MYQFAWAHIPRHKSNRAIILFIVTCFGYIFSDIDSIFMIHVNPYSPWKILFNGHKIITFGQHLVFSMFFSQSILVISLYTVSSQHSYCHIQILLEKCFQMSIRSSHLVYLPFLICFPDLLFWLLLISYWFKNIFSIF